MNYVYIINCLDGYSDCGYYIINVHQTLENAIAEINNIILFRSKLKWKLETFDQPVSRDHHCYCDVDTTEYNFRWVREDNECVLHIEKHILKSIAPTTILDILPIEICTNIKKYIKNR
jgi:hypothetical protein